MNLLKHLRNFQRYNKSLNISLFAIYTMGITVLSLSPHTQVSMVLSYQDKIHHIIGYALFTFFAWRLTHTKKWFSRASIGIVLYGGLIEVLQSFTGRFMSSLDFVANGCGVALMFFILCQQSYSIARQ